MPELKNVHLLKYGKIPLPDGNELNIDKKLITDLANSYAPSELHEAPAILGHEADSTKRPNDGAPAFGWLKRLYHTDKGLYGDFDITKDFAKWIKSKHYKKLSISFYPAESNMSPTKGKPYMRHVAFLGAEAPVVKGLEPYSLSEKLNLNLTEITMQDAPTFTTEQAEEWLRALLADGTKGYKDDIIAFEPRPSEENNFLMDDDSAIKGTFLNEQNIKFVFDIAKTSEGYSRTFEPENQEEASMIQEQDSSSVAEMGEELIDALPEQNEEPEVEQQDKLEELEAESMGEAKSTDEVEPMDEVESMGEAESTDEVESMGESEALMEMRRELAEMRAQLAETKDAKLRAEMQQFTDKLYSEGKLLKSYAEPQALSEFMFGLAKQEALIVNLSETEKPSGIEWFKNFINNLPRPIELNEIANASPEKASLAMPELPGMVSHDNERTELHSKVISLCEQQGLNYHDPVVYRSILRKAIKN